MPWLVRNDVDNGPKELNFSEWGEFGKEADDAIEDGSMPLSQYTLIHRDAKLTAEEKQILIAALEAWIRTRMTTTVATATATTDPQSTSGR